MLDIVLEETHSLLIQDTTHNNGRLLLKAIALQSLQRCSYVHVFLFDAHPQSWLNGVSHDLVQRLTIHDCYTDHLGWRKKSSPAPLHEATPTSITNELKTTPTHTAIVIDSVSTLLHFHNTVHICRLVHQLGRECGLVVGLLHSDLHDSHVISQLNHVISTIIEINPLSSTLHSLHHFQLGVKHCKNSGKLSITTELVTISNEYDITSSVVTHTTPSHHQLPPETDPTDNLTFNLTLTDQEREDRDKLILPYHHSAKKKSALLQAGSGKIFYQPDEVDDYDDSDPDDDLEI